MNDDLPKGLRLFCLAEFERLARENSRGNCVHTMYAKLCWLGQELGQPIPEWNQSKAPLPCEGPPLDLIEAIAVLRQQRDELLLACEVAEDGMAHEWLYQTGQTVRPAKNYPKQGTICGELSAANEKVILTLRKIKAAT